jgi:hypothetical protein
LLWQLYVTQRVFGPYQCNGEGIDTIQFSWRPCRIAENWCSKTTWFYQLKCSFQMNSIIGGPHASCCSNFPKFSSQMFLNSADMGSSQPMVNDLTCAMTYLAEESECHPKSTWAGEVNHAESITYFLGPVTANLHTKSDVTWSVPRALPAFNTSIAFIKTVLS